MIQRFLVRGRVQGVGYRWFVARHARGLGLGGFVRNLPDGRVEVVASGEPAVLDELGRQLSVGPSGSRVDAVEPGPPPEQDVFTAFEIH